MTKKKISLSYEDVESVLSSYDCLALKSYEILAALTLIHPISIIKYMLFSFEPSYLSRYGKRNEELKYIVTRSRNVNDGRGFYGIWATRLLDYHNECGIYMRDETIFMYNTEGFKDINNIFNLLENNNIELAKLLMNNVSKIECIRFCLLNGYTSKSLKLISKTVPEFNIHDLVYHSLYPISNLPF